MMRGPWYISVRAVRDYLALTGQPDVTQGPIFDRASEALIAMAETTIASGRQPVPINTAGARALRYRGPSPQRYQLIVVPAPRAEGERPQLVRVLPSHGHV